MIICPKCQFSNEDATTECVRCGIVFKHFPKSDDSPSESSGISWQDILIPESTTTTTLHVAARAGIWCLLTWLGVRFIADGLGGTYAMQSFLHLINLPFHEAGHVFTRPFPPVMTALGGSIGQLTVPLLCLFVLLLRTRDAFGSAVCLWWFGQNFIDLAPYINDARSLSLPLLGDNIGSEAPYGFHDWEFILKEMGLAVYDHVLAKTVHATGSVLMVLALVWAGIVLARQYREIR